MLLLDGPMGTRLEALGVATPAPGWSAHALDTAPDVVRSIHEEYARAGATVLRTNTFRAQPHLFGDRHRELVATAVRLARSAAGGARIAGSIAPVLDCYRPDLSPPADEARAIHVAMARALATEGVDLLVCETFPHAGEARIAVAAAAATGLETWAALTAGPDGTLMTAPEMERAAKDCIAAGAAAVLVCCTDAELTRRYVEALAGLGVPFGAYANAGPGISAERYAALASTWIATGASIVGSCCGTGPEHVARLVLPEVREVLDARERDAARALVVAHATALSSPAIHEDAAALPGPYVSPRGGIWIAWIGSEAAGSIALKPLGPDIAEIKRMYVLPSARGRGIARRLVERVVAAARQRGYRRVRLGTLPGMTAAVALYTSVGFRPIEAYRAVEIADDTVFYELDLAAPVR